MEAWRAAKNALKCVLEAKKGESITIFTDREKMAIAEAFADGAMKLGLKTHLVPLQAKPKEIRNDVSLKPVEMLTRKRSDIYINLLRGVREETPFRIKLIHMEVEGGNSRLGHCPGVTLDMLTEGAMALTEANHGEMQGFARRFMEKLSGAEKVEITNPAGTELSLNVDGRPFFTDTMIYSKTRKWMNLPTGEVLVAPVENSLRGDLVCDMAIGGIGPLETPVKLTVQDGKVQKSVSKNANVLKRVRDSLDTDAGSCVVGEFAFGINSKARFVEEFLEAEKIKGTIHIAFGDNRDMPCGKNASKNHMDLLVSKPTVKVHKSDGSVLSVLTEGVFQYI